jgi:ABC-type nitrate/sulfonate/bicarbonate transport system substrate-binding protein
MPTDVDAVVPWDPVATLITTEQKNGRAIDVSYPYNVYQGSFVIHNEIIEKTPDVARAIVETLVEADLWLRKSPERGADAMKALPELASFPRSLLLAQIKEYNTLYKPTYVYPIGKFWAGQNQNISFWLHLNKRLSRLVSREDYETGFYAGPMRDVFTSLGWKIPSLPPYISDEWLMRANHMTLPAYPTFDKMKTAQSWPEKGDLVR